MPTTLRRPDYLRPVAPTTRPRPDLAPIAEDLFRSVLVRERRRADRSNQPLALILISKPDSVDESALRWTSVVEALTKIKRDTDLLGWFEADATVGLILPEFPATPIFLRELTERTERELSRQLGAGLMRRLVIQVHGHPGSQAERSAGAVDAVITQTMRRQYDAVKRAIDVVVSLALLVMLAPLLLVIAALIKLTSQGPVFFSQERVGQMMKPFTMLKFRTMRVDADAAIHHDFVSSFISSGALADSGVFKIANDPRVTPIGRFLRRTSLDELPQFWNVLRGDMSLVGPRPPIQYEVNQYKSWHTRRVLDAKPGLTGLWQVTGRSRTTFDDMVRLDIRYARTLSLWADMKILLATPGAVISGKGAC